MSKKRYWPYGGYIRLTWYVTQKVKPDFMKSGLTATILGWTVGVAHNLWFCGAKLWL